jgi:hypothetical protein
MPTEFAMWRVGDKVKTEGLGEYPDGTVGEVIGIKSAVYYDLAYWVSFDGLTAEVVLDDYLGAAEQPTAQPGE